MPVRRIVVTDPAGLHARPAARFVQVANKFTSRIAIRHGGREADAKSLVGLLGMTIRPETEIELVADGPDAEAALDALTSELGPYLANATPAVAGDPSPA